MTKICKKHGLKTKHPKCWLCQNQTYAKALLDGDTAVTVRAAEEAFVHAEQEFHMAMADVVHGALTQIWKLAFCEGVRVGATSERNKSGLILPGQ